MQTVVNKSLVATYRELEPRLTRPQLGLLHYLITNRHRKDIPLFYGFLKRLNGVKNKNTRSFHAETFLESFRDIFPNFAYSDYQKGKARTVITMGIPDIFYTEFLNNISVDDTKIFLESGKKVNSKNIKQVYEEYNEYVSDFRAHSERSQQMMDYQNGHDSRMFTRQVNEFLPVAREFVESNYHGDKYHSAMYGLNQVSVISKPYYKSVPNSDRIFSVSTSMLTLNSDLRKILTTGMYECDMTNAQLAIIARVWNVPELNEFLLRGKSIWSELLEFLGLPMSYKPVLKVSLYGLCFGSGKDGLVNAANEEFEKEGLEPFDILRVLEHPLMSILASKQKQAMRDVMEHTPINPLTEQSIYGKPTSRLAKTAQAYEQKLIHSFYEVQDDSGFQIMLQQHDGVTVSFRDERTRDYWIQRINERFAEKANELGIITSLEWSYNSSVDSSQDITTTLIDDSEIFSVTITQDITQDFSRMSTEELEELSDNDPFSGAYEEIQARQRKPDEPRYTHAPF